MPRDPDNKKKRKTTDTPSADRYKRFLEAIAHKPHISEAIASSGLTRWEVYYRRTHDEEFKRQWDEALWLGKQAAVDTLVDLAMNGEDTPYGKDGQFYKKRDTRALIKYLESNVPEYARQGTSVTINNNQLNLSVQPGEEGLYSELREQLAQNLTIEHKPSETNGKH